MNAPLQKACAWSGFVCIVTFFLGFWVIAGFIPPPSPKASPAEIAELFRDDTTQIRIGMIIAMYSASLIAVWSAGMLCQLRRIEGRSPAFSYAQFGLGAVLSLEFIYLIMFWQVAAFRNDRSADSILLLNDMAWIPFVGLTSTGVMQFLIIGITMLRDRRDGPIFPRWAGYFNIWVGFMVMPGSLCVFFKDGPFAWTGLLAWYLPLTAFSLFMLVNSGLLLKAIKHQELEEANQPAPAEAGLDGKIWDVERLASQLMLLQKEIARVSARD